MPVRPDGPDPADGEAGYADVETASADYASRFAGPAGRYLLGAQEQATERLLAPFAGGSVLDVGGGHGQLLALYRRLGMSVRLHGSDPVCFARLDAAALAGVETLVAPPERLGLDDASVDVVVSVRLVPHTDDWPALLSEFCRVARQAVIVDYPSTRSLNGLTPLLFAFKKRLEGNTRTYLSFAPRQIHGCFADAGFGRIDEIKQFFLPMVVHRQLGGGALARTAEAVSRRLGLTALLGSPVMVRARAAAAP